MAENSKAINRIFSQNVINDLLKTGSNEVFDYVVSRFVNDPNSKTHGELFSEIYSHLGRENRNEYYYTNTLLNKLLIGIHNVNTTTALAQIRIGRHIADFIMINGDAYLYEIKSDLDNFSRLADQLKDYYQAFSYVSVLASNHDLEKVERVLSLLGNMGNSVGIYVLSNNGTIFSKTFFRKPELFVDCLDHTSIFKLLRKHEYENVIRQTYSDVPKVAPVYFFRACLNKFQEIPILDAQKLALRELKKRNKISKVDFDSIQNELKSVVYFSSRIRNLSKLDQLLKTIYKGASDVFSIP
jgi:hypothetical protein